MSTRYLILCGSTSLSSRDPAWRAVRPIRLCLGDGREDVHLHIEHLTRRMCAGLPDVAVDLVELAAFVYAADQASSRGGTRDKIAATRPGRGDPGPAAHDE